MLVVIAVRLIEGNCDTHLGRLSILSGDTVPLPAPLGPTCVLSKECVRRLAA